MKKTLLFTLILSMLLCTLAGCAAAGAPKDDMNAGVGNQIYNRPAEEVAGGNADYVSPDGNQQGFVENPFVSTQTQAVSTFSADVDTASYTYFRKLINNNYKWQTLKDQSVAFRAEEFLNYFRYTANKPQNGELFGVTTAIASCPWNPENHLMRLTLQADDAVESTGNNLVFLIDVSGSMSSIDKLPLLKKSFGYLVSQLTERDRVSIVTYSGKEEVILSCCPGNQGERILQAINSLEASGSTNGEAGLRRAYEQAEVGMIAGGNNRIILASDGDLNVGIRSPEELKNFIAEKRNLGIYLSVLGFGTGNYRDASMESLADNGNGVYYYIDGETEAEKIFATELLSTLYTVAKDVKLQITFDPKYVSSWRLIGYENRILNEEDFKDDTKDAGEVGAGHQVTVFYELALTNEIASQADEGTSDEAASTGEAAGDWMKLAVRYKRPSEDISLLNEYGIGASSLRLPDSDFLFQTALIETVMLLHQSKYIGNITLSAVLSQLNALDLSATPDRAEFRTLIAKLVG